MSPKQPFPQFPGKTPYCLESLVVLGGGLYVSKPPLIGALLSFITKRGLEFGE